MSSIFRSHKFWIGLAVLIVVSFGIVSAVAAFVFFYGESKRSPLPEAHSADVILILGAGTHPNGEPSRGQIRRVNHAVVLYQQAVAPYIFCTGGLDKADYLKSEAQACVDQAVALGVPASAILREDISLNTEQNLIEAKKVLDAHHLQTVVLVSDSYHLFRAGRLVAHYGLDVIAYSAAQGTQGDLPLFEGLWASYREVGAMVWDTLRILQGH